MATCGGVRLCWLLKVLAALWPTLSLTATVAAADPPRPLPATTVVVSPLFYRAGQAATDTTEAVAPIGLCQDFELTVGGFPPGKIRIGVVDTRIGGSSRLWNATTWQAALTASQLLGYDPKATQATLAVSGAIDGPSAGALLTVGVLAGAQGHTIDPRMTMTGTINPDGEIGPVGGIPYKIEGAARAGKKVVLVPKMSPLELDERVGKMVDLVAHGKKHGVEVRLVNDIWTAYREFTGKSLPRPRDVDPPALPLEASEQLEKRVDRWLAFETSSREKYDAWGERGRSDYADSHFEEAALYREQAELLRQQGAYAAAYSDSQWAAINATVGHQVGRCEYVYAGDGIAAVQAMLADDAWVESETEKLESALKFFRPATLAQLPYYMWACDQFLVGLVYQDLGKAIAENLPDDEEKAGLQLIEAAERQALAWLAMKVGYDYLELANLEAGAPIPPDAPLEGLTELYMRCAEANQAVVDELVVTPAAKANNLAQDEMKGRLTLVDPFYGLNSIALRSTFHDLPRRFGETEQLEYARLGAAISLNSRSAMLIAKFYSLGAKLDDELAIVDISNEPALNDWLDDSRGQARRAIQSLVEADIDATFCTQLYSIARIEEGRNLSGRIGALQAYFDINVMCQVMKRVAGK
ncbi:MAG: S16 family serine protease [Lacipirellulaceae bacterium]